MLLLWLKNMYEELFALFRELLWLLHPLDSTFAVDTKIFPWLTVNYDFCEMDLQEL